MSGTSLRTSIIKKNITKNNLKILDIGCGPAQILEHIPECDYYGYDIDSRSIQSAKKKYHKKRVGFLKNKERVLEEKLDYQRRELNKKKQTPIVKPFINDSGCLLLSKIIKL